MAEPKLIPQQFQVQPQAIASFDWTTLAAGTSIQNYYPIAEKNSSETEYHLIETPYNSALIEITTGGTYTFQTGDFDLARYVKGTSYFSGNFYSHTGTNNVSVKLQKWDGTTATDLTATHTSANGGSTTNVPTFLSMPITTEANIARGDSLRIVVVWTTGAGDSKLGISPTNQTSPTGNLTPTQMIMGVSFRTKL